VRIFPQLIYSLIFFLILSQSFFAFSKAVPKDTIRIHYNRVQADYKGWAIHLWGEDLLLEKSTTWFAPFKPTGEDEFGIYFDIPIKPNSRSIGFILHNKRGKNVEQDLTVIIKIHGYEIWQLQNDSIIYDKEPKIPGSQKELRLQAEKEKTIANEKEQTKLKALAFKRAKEQKLQQIEAEKTRRLLEQMKKNQQKELTLAHEKSTILNLTTKLDTANAQKKQALEQLVINQKLLGAINDNMSALNADLNSAKAKINKLDTLGSSTKTQLNRVMEQRNQLLKDMKNQAISIWFWVVLALSSLLIIFIIIKQRNVSNINQHLQLELDNFTEKYQEECQRHEDTERKINKIASNDVVTGLLNRGIFQQNAQHAVAQAKRYGRTLAFLFIDLDRFKSINDTLGHDAGDIVLRTIAERFKLCTRTSDTLARLGGDEFVLLIEDISDTKYVSIIAHKLLTAASQPFLLAGQEYQVTASVGISAYPDDGKNASTLLKNADIAMYRAKEKGKNNFQFYSEQMNVHSLQRMALESNLRQALQREELRVYFQPIVDIRKNEVYAVEALVRWQHPDMGLVSPLQFIPIAEETGLIIPIGAWILEQVCIEGKKWHDAGYKIRVTVNLSPKQLDDPKLLTDIKQALDTTSFAAEYMTIELTESMMMTDPDKTVELFQTIKDLNIRIAIDDFGTGYSSLSYLKRFPIDILKIDRSFLQDVPNDPDDVAITQTIIAIGQKMGLDLIAEGVEDIEQLEFLEKENCHYIQGFYFSKPLPPEDIINKCNEIKEKYKS